MQDLTPPGLVRSRVAQLSEQQQRLAAQQHQLAARLRTAAGAAEQPSPPEPKAGKFLFPRPAAPEVELPPSVSHRRRA